MSIAQFALLRTIARNQPVPLMRLASLLVMDRTTLYRGLKPLARDGWIAIDDGEGRAKTARLTDRGREGMVDATEAWETVQDRLLNRIGRESWAEIAVLLGQLVTIATEEAR